MAFRRWTGVSNMVWQLPDTAGSWRSVWPSMAVIVDMPVYSVLEAGMSLTTTQLGQEDSTGGTRNRSARSNQWRYLSRMRPYCFATWNCYLGILASIFYKFVVFTWKFDSQTCCISKLIESTRLPWFYGHIQPQDQCFPQFLLFNLRQK